MWTVKRSFMLLLLLLFSWVSVFSQAALVPVEVLKSYDQKLAVLEQSLTLKQASLNQSANDIQNYKQNIQDLKKDIQKWRNDYQVLNQNFQGLNRDYQKQNQEFQKLLQDYQEILKRFQKLEEDYERILKKLKFWKKATFISAGVALVSGFFAGLLVR